MSKSAAGRDASGTSAWDKRGLRPASEKAKPMPEQATVGQSSQHRLPSTKEVAGRLLNRKNASLYMGVCVKTFDPIRHLFAVDVNGVIRYDTALMDRYIDLHRLAA